MDACGKAATVQRQDPRSWSYRGDEEVVEHKVDFGHWRQHQDGETTGDDDDEPSEKYWRVEDFVPKASMDELTGNWLTDENGIFDNDAAEDTWAACLATGGELDRQAEDEGTEVALESLLAHGVVKDMKREDATRFKSLTTWDKRWKMKNGEWKMKVRFVGRKYEWA